MSSLSIRKVCEWKQIQPWSKSSNLQWFCLKVFFFNSQKTLSLFPSPWLHLKHDNQPCSVLCLALDAETSLLFEISHPLRLPLSNAALALRTAFRALIALLVLISCMMWFFLILARIVVWELNILKLKLCLWETYFFNRHVSV